MKKYKAIFFDWDGTAVTSRKAPADKAVEAMKPLLAKGVKLVIVSGTTIENIAQGRLEELFTKEELSNLYLGLGRGAYNYAFDKEGKAFVFKDEIPDKKTLSQIHKICFDIHLHLLEQYDFQTDIVFSRPNYCKIDLMVTQNRGESLFMQENELELLKTLLSRHGIKGGLQDLIDLSIKTGKSYGLDVQPTCDAKYLEVGISSKSDNVNSILEMLSKQFGIQAEDCSFWGDEYVGIEEGIFGSDSFMLTPQTAPGDFYDVSQVPGKRPQNVRNPGGGVPHFLNFLKAQAL